jgi:hypothetical protein
MRIAMLSRLIPDRFVLLLLAAVLLGWLLPVSGQGLAIAQDCQLHQHFCAVFPAWLAAAASRSGQGRAQLEAAGGDAGRFQLCCHAAGRAGAGMGGRVDAACGFG